MFSLRNLGSAFVTVDKACAGVAANEAKGLVTIAELNQCRNTASEQGQTARRTLLIIGAGAAVGLWLLLR